MVIDFYQPQLGANVTVCGRRNGVNVTFQMKKGRLCISAPLSKLKYLYSDDWPDEVLAVARKVMDRYAAACNNAPKFRFDVPVYTDNFSIVVVRACGLEGSNLVSLYDVSEKVLTIRTRWVNIDSPDRQIELKKAVKRRLKDILHILFYDDLLVWSKRFDFDMERLGFCTARTRLGSCSSLGYVRLSGYLSFFAKEFVEYVFVHEMSHLTYMNHGPEFRSLVRRYLPDCDERELQLRRRERKYLWLFV